MKRAGNFGPTWSVFLSGKVAHIELIVLYMHIHPPFPIEPVPCSHKWQQNKWFMWHFWLYWTQWLKENNLCGIIFIVSSTSLCMHTAQHFQIQKMRTWWMKDLFCQVSESLDRQMMTVRLRFILFYDESFCVCVNWSALHRAREAF